MRSLQQASLQMRKENFLMISTLWTLKKCGLQGGKAMDEDVWDPLLDEEEEIDL